MAWGDVATPRKPRIHELQRPSMRSGAQGPQAPPRLDPDLQPEGWEILRTQVSPRNSCVSLDG